MDNLTEDERKLVTLMKCWVKISIGCGKDGGLHETFVRDWKALQRSINKRLYRENKEEAKKIISDVEKEIEQYIRAL